MAVARRSGMYESQAGDFSMCLAGEVILQRRLSVFREPQFLRLVELIRGSDAAALNLEGVVHEFQGPPGAKRHGLYWTAIAPQALEDLRWMGFNMVSNANNHALDYGEWALLNTIKECERAGLAHAGTGPTLRDARAPAYLDTPRGRVALIGVSGIANYPEAEESFRAGEQTPYHLGRPGVSGIGIEAENVVLGEDIRLLQKLGNELGIERQKESMRDLGMLLPEDSDKVQHLFGQKFVRGEARGRTTRPNAADLADVVRQVQEASRQAEWVIVSMHLHEDMFNDQPPQCQIDVARAVIDAGAHIFAGHGPHTPRGVEIYKGRPIFYGLGQFVLQVESIPKVTQRQQERYGLDYGSTPSEYILTQTKDETILFPPRKEYFQTILPICRWEGGRLKQIEVYPIELGFKTPWGARGRPVLAAPEDAAAILAHFGGVCAGLGTRLDIAGETGIIKPQASQQVVPCQ